MARIGKEEIICDLCGTKTDYETQIETQHRVKGKALHIRTPWNTHLCEECFAGLLADGKLMPIRFRNAPFFWPGLVLGLFAGFMVAATLMGK